MTHLNLRPYQRECIDKIIEQHKSGIHRQLISLPTGSGKTVVFASLIQEFGYRALVLAHKNELLKQAKEKIQMICPDLDVGLVNGQSKQFDTHVVVSSIQAAANPSTLDHLKEQSFGLVIIDEAHSCGSDGYRKLLSYLGFGKDTEHLLVGFSATPFRQDGRGLAEVFDIIAYERNIKQMIDEGYLCRPKGLKIATDLDLRNAKISDGDFQAESLSRIVDTPEINAIVVDAYLKTASEIQAICFGITIQHAKNLNNEFQRHGVSSKVVFGDMPRQERESIIEDYKSGKIQVLCNCQVLTEGFDAPQTGCVIIARPTMSRGLYQQMVGRGLRIWMNKHECIVLDIGDRNHNICDAAILTQDADNAKERLEREKTDKEKETVSKLPINLNRKLKSAILSFDPLGESFTWIKESNNIYSIKGAGVQISVIPKDDCYQVKFIRGTGPYSVPKIIAHGLSFEYAFGVAEEFAKKNRSLFTVSDLEANWRALPISNKQKSFFHSLGYKAGIESLSRGQASLIISSGVLSRKAARR